MAFLLQKEKKKESLNFHPCQKQWRSHRADGNKRSKQKKDTEILEAQRSCEKLWDCVLTFFEKWQHKERTVRKYETVPWVSSYTGRENM